MEFTSEFFAGNRQRLQKLFTGTAPVVITANGLMQKATDETFPFRQDGSFWYLTGINEPNVVLVIDKFKEYLIVPELTASREYFDGALSLDDISQTSGIKDIVTEKEGWKRLGSRLKKSTSVATLEPLPLFIDDMGMYPNPARRNLLRQLKSHNGNLEVLDLKKHLSQMRMVKQPVELEALTQSVEITAQALKKVYKKYHAGRYKNEFEIELELAKAFHASGGQGHGFSPIVAAGKKGCTIHPFGNHGDIGDQSLLVDVGAIFNNYNADISRTWDAQPSKRMRDVHQAVVEVVDYAFGIVKPGVKYRKYEEAIEHFMGEKLRALGLIKTIDHENVRKYFPHATSHFLGIDVHDSGDYGKALEPGVVITIEPGIYIPREGIAVRIEEDVLITKTGNQNLSEQLPRGL